MKIVVIGSGSFLAGYIIRELMASQIKPTLYGRTPSLEFPSLGFKVFDYPEHPLDYRDLLEYDAIIYTAGSGIQAGFSEPPETLYELNSFIPIRLSNDLVSNNYKGKVLTFGSYFEIGSEWESRYYSENEILSSLKTVPNHYCSSKRLFSRYLSSSPQTNSFYHLMLPNIYGPGENPKRLIPYLIKCLKNNEKIQLTDGQQVRQYIHAADIAFTVLDILKGSYRKGFYNVCCKEAIRIKELVRKIFIIIDQPHFPDEASLFGSAVRNDTSMPYLLMDNAKAVASFGYQPHISLEEGIKTYLV